MSPYVRTVKTASGATAVQIVYSFSRGSRRIEHLGLAHDQAQLELLKAAARQRLAAGQDELDLGLASTSAPVCRVRHCAITCPVASGASRHLQSFQSGGQVGRQRRRRGGHCWLPITSPIRSPSA